MIGLRFLGEILNQNCGLYQNLTKKSTVLSSLKDGHFVITVTLISHATLFFH